MGLNITEAASLAAIDRQIERIQSRMTPAEYEIVRQVIYHTADFEYQSLLKFSNNALVKGAAALTAATPIIVDVPEIQVSIVPQLQKTFINPVYCCTTSAAIVKPEISRAASGLAILAERYPNSISILGSDRDTLSKTVALLQDKKIEPCLIISTPPLLIEPEIQQQLRNFSIPTISTAGSKGGANVAAAIFNSLVSLAWRAKQM